MSFESTSAGRGASLRGRALVRLRAERGDTLMEVIVAALMVALIATASLGGFSDVGKLSQSQRNEEQAATLAQQDQARLRGLTITQLASSGAGTGNTSTTTQIDGTTYKVTSATAFISGSTGSSACAGSNGADEVQTTSTVTWGQSNGGRNPVVVHGLITPAEGGALVATVVDPTGAGLPGVTVSLSGPTAVSPVTTDSSGCVIWTGLAAGSYTVSYAPPAGTWITSTGGTVSNQTLSVTAGATAHANQVQIGSAASVQASFTTNWTGTPVTNESDTFMLFDTTGSSPTSQLFGTDSTRGSNTYAASISTSTNLYPYPATLPSDNYDAYAGGCVGDDPGRTNDPGFTLTGGQVNPETIKEPALIVKVYGNSYDDNNSGWTYSGTHWTASTIATNAYDGTEHTNSGAVANEYAQISFTGTGVQWIATYGPSYGKAGVYIDGTLKTTIDTYSASTTYQKQAYSITGLTNGPHTLKILVTHTKNGSSSGYTVSIDAVNVVGGTPNVVSPAPETIAPTVSVTDNNTGCGSNVDYPPTQAPSINPAQGALQFPGEIYGSLIVCADNGTYKNTATVTNTNFSSPGTPVTINLYNGATGRTAGTC
jgi:type II secretory pathway pseudopilin PulG